MKVSAQIVTIQLYDEPVRLGLSKISKSSLATQGACAQCHRFVFISLLLHILSFGLQVQYQDGTKKMLDSWFAGEPFPEENYIVREGRLASQYS